MLQKQCVRYPSSTLRVDQVLSAAYPLYMAHQRLSSIKSTQYPLNIRIGMSSGAAGRIHMSDATRQALIQPFSYEHCGVIQVKDKGAMSTWFLNDRALS
jgi:hypothetical protein